MPIVRQLVGSPEISRYVTLTGLVPQSEAPEYLACADVLVSPHIPNKDGSRFFGSPTKLFEYMAMEKPIIAAALGQIEGVISGKGASELSELPPGAGELLRHHGAAGARADHHDVGLFAHVAVVLGEDAHLALAGAGNAHGLALV